MARRFVDLIGLTIEERGSGHSRLSLVVAAEHLNAHGRVHGAVVFALADTGMGAALYPTLAEGQLCATIEIKINYHSSIADGRLVCVTELVHCGQRVANLESKVYVGERLVASANGHYAIFTPRAAA